jgi:hypothetical protein
VGRAELFEHACRAGLRSGKDYLRARPRCSGGFPVSCASHHECLSCLQAVADEDG